MPPLEQMDRYQKAVLWPKVGVDGFGEPVTGKAIEIAVRWRWGRGELLGPQDETIAIDATAVVDRKIDIGSIMWLGRLEDFVGTGVDSQDNELMTVVANSETPDIKGRNYFRSVSLRRFRDQLPASS